MTEKFCFDFLRLAVGGCSSFPSEITDGDWHALFEFCKRQALIGVGFFAVERLHVRGVECPKALRMRWYALVSRIEKRNDLLNEQCRALAGQYAHDGLSTCVLKGQGNLLNYPDELRGRRQSGDIDVWCLPAHGELRIAVQTGKGAVDYSVYRGRRAVIEYVLMRRRLAGSAGKPIIRYHHIEAPLTDNTEVEVHFRPGYVHSPLRNRSMQRWFDAQADVCMNNMTHLGFAVPTSSVNVVYQMTHLFTHYFDEGVGLRQLTDYYFALKTWHNDSMDKNDLQSQGLWTEGLGVQIMSREEVMRTLKSFGMCKFAAAVMWVLHEVFALPAHYYICPPDARRGRELLDEIMRGGNFGMYDERGAWMKNGGTVGHGIWKLRRVMRLLRSYPEEALCEPIFRVYHLFWRITHNYC